MNIYVGNLPSTVVDEDLKQIFAEYGVVSSARIIMDRDTNQSKGFGFVEMNDNSARKAIAELHEMEIENKTITVNEARPKNDFNNNRGGGFQKRW
jgi:RNA recognition motif-containing protein